jgi:hypothetical protein
MWYSTVLLFRQFSNCRRWNSIPVKRPHPFLLTGNVVFADFTEAGNGHPGRFFHDHGIDRQQAVTMTPPRDQFQWPSQ